MANDYTPISMIRGSSTIVDSTPIVDGQILFDETRKCLFMDNGSTREKYSGLGADSNIANVEDTTTASQPYTTGEFVVVEGQLYKVTASIATGDTFSVGTNIATDTVGSEITKINNDLTDNNKQFKFGYQNGEYGYYKQEGGADTFSPFKSSLLFYLKVQNGNGTGANVGMGRFELTAENNKYKTLTLKSQKGPIGQKTVTIDGVSQTWQLNTPYDIEGKAFFVQFFVSSSSAYNMVTVEIELS